ncbi:penicillin-binding protein 2 [bacterium]|nr:penicillin-binding protein 2 [bacterium]
MNDNNSHNQERNKIFNKRIIGLKIIYTIFAICLVCYLFAIQIVDVKHYSKKAQAQRKTKKFVMRGSILDRNGVKLASDQLSYNVYLHRQYLDHTPEEIAKRLSEYLNLSETEIVRRINSNKNDIVLLKKDIDRPTTEAMRKLGLREISTDRKNCRIYPQDEMAAHILGYYNADADVAAGVEFTMKKELEKVDKDIVIETTRGGDVIYDFRTDPEKITSPTVGKTVTLTIDSAIQHVCEKELLKMITEKEALRGAVIVMNPNNGEILGYAVYPTYNPNEFKTATYNQIKNWTLTDVYPPGSTFKVLTVASAVQNNKIHRNSTVVDSGQIQVGGWTISNYDYHKFPYPGNINMEYLFQHSSNVGSLRVAFLMTPKEFYNTLYKFGIGQKTGIDLPGESSGLLPKPETWDVSRHASMGYGYGASVTAIQLITAVAAIANDGLKITPHVVKYSDEELPKHVKKVRVMDPEKARLVTEFLTKSTSRSKTAINLPNYQVASKTGTSRKTMEGAKGYTNKLYTSAVGYLPASDPQVIIYVVIDSASGWEIWGSTVAVPVFAAVAKQVARIMNLKSDKSKNSGYKPCTRPLPDLEAEQREMETAKLQQSPYKSLFSKNKYNNILKGKNNIKNENDSSKKKIVKPVLIENSGKINRKRKN